MKLAEFKQLAEQGYNRIPLVREVLADLDRYAVKHLSKVS